MKDKVQGARWAPVFFLRRALSEAESKTRLKLSASHTCALNESKSETQHEFSAAGSAEQLENESKAQLELSAAVIWEIPYRMRRGIERENRVKYPE